MRKVLITRQIPDKGIKILQKEGFDLWISKKDTALSKEELISALKSFQPDALLCLLTDKIDKEVFDSAPIKICATYSVGFNHIDLEAAKQKGVVVTHTPGVLTNAVAEFTLAAIFTLAKKITQADKWTRAGNYKGWDPNLFLGDELSHKTISVIGAGRIGSEVAKRLHALGIKLVYYDIRENDELKNLGIEFLSLEDALKVADYITLHVPLLPSTKHLINSESLKIMKDGVKIINTSRGAVIDEKALLEALQSGKVSAAFLDVFENEPKFEEELRVMPNVVLTPHIASATEETRQKMSEMAAKSIVDFFEGKVPEHIVSFD